MENEDHELLLHGIKKSETIARRQFYERINRESRTRATIRQVAFWLEITWLEIKVKWRMRKF